MTQKHVCNVYIASGQSVCEEKSGSLAPQILLFGAQLISGVGQTLFYSLGTTYMDDNVQKSKTASFISIYSSVFQAKMHKF